MPEAPSIQLDARPKLRGDLILRCQTEGEAEIWIVKDPVAERFFRFRSIEGFILGQLDGATALEAIRHRVEAEFGATLPPETLTQFVARLERIGLLGGTAAAPLSKARMRGSILYLRLKAFDPNQTLEWLHARLGFFFTSGF